MAFLGNGMAEYAPVRKKAEAAGGITAGDLTGGLAAMLVALPSAIAFGLIIYAPLGQAYAGRGALAGIIASALLGIMAPLFGGTPRLISAPCAPAAAVLSVFVAGAVSGGSVEPDMVPVYIGLIACFTGIIQVVAGLAGGGTFIKYIPYPVVAGYLSGVGILIFIGQVPGFLGAPKGTALLQAVAMTHLWRWESIVIGAVTVIVMLVSPLIIRAVPASIAALGSGIACYFLITAFNPRHPGIENNPLIIGRIDASAADIASSVMHAFHSVAGVRGDAIAAVMLPALTLGVLLSIDTLKTCVVLDVLAGTRHNSNRELFGQGIANISSALCGGIPGSGTMGGTLVNVYSGGTTRFSGIVSGVSALAVLLLFSRFIAYIPLSSLAGVLLVVGVRMIDRKSFHLLRHRSTVFDFAVILAVIVAAVSMSLIAAAGVGIALAIVLFLREQIRFPVVRRLVSGSQTFSKKNRLTSEHAIIEEKGKQTLVIELQGQLFFGTTDQLYTEIEPHIGERRYFILDMRRVLSVDFTAANMLTQIKRKISESGGMLIFSSVPVSVPTGQNVRGYLETLGFARESHEVLFFEDLDAALEWVEDEYLREAGADSITHHAYDLSEFSFFRGASAQALSTLRQSVEERTYCCGEKIFRRGDAGGEIYFIKRGAVRIALPLSMGTAHHLSTFGRGDFFGDMSFLDREPRSADAIAEDEVELYALDRERFDRIAAQYPEIAGIFYNRLAYEISRRLRLNVIELKALEEN